MAPVSTTASNKKPSKKPTKRRTIIIPVPDNNTVADAPIEPIVEHPPSSSFSSDQAISILSTDQSIQFPSTNKSNLPLTSDTANSKSSSSTTTTSSNDINDMQAIVLRKESSVWQFAIRTDTNDIAMCKLCNASIKTTNWSTTGLRKHLTQVHKLPTIEPPVLTEKAKMSNLLKGELHSLVISAIVKDGRSFNDFRRTGMMKFLAKATPGIYLHQS